MRTYVFTKKERRLLEEWLQTGRENDETRKVFTWIRANVPQLRRDLKLLVRVHGELVRRRRWKGRITGKNELESLLRRAESALNRIRREGSTSAASNG